ncbi:MAG: S53 family peptidase [Candidatus Dormibacteria bacterium]
MRIGRAASLTAVAALATYSVATAAVATAATAPAARTGASAVFAPVCPPSAAPGVASCSAIQLLDPALNWHGVHVAGSSQGSGKGPGKKPVGGTTFTGYTPQELWSAYGLGSTSAPPSGGTGQTVAVVDAYDDPNAAADLAVYRSKEGLPPLCGTPTPSTGCSGPSFTKEDQLGGTSYPTASTSWSEEISLDLDMVSAICPNCNILLVEANSASFSDLTTAEAIALGSSGVVAVSNSYGASEFKGETAYNLDYNSTKAAVTVSAGDGGYGVEFPAADPYVVAVGGTTLSNPSQPGSETVWSGTGSGCSAYEGNPGWQPITSLCGTRTVADVSADANPSTGVAVYDTYGESGWLVFGGTSVASPIVASVFALAG